MEMPPSGQVAYPQWWALAQYAAAHTDTAGHYDFQPTDLSSAVADIARAEGRSATFQELAGASFLFGVARTMETKADRLTALPDDGIIGADHISEAPYSRSLAEQNANPVYRLRAEITYRAPDGTVITDWGTGVFYNSPPVTAGAMRAEAILQFQRMLAKRDEQKNTGGELLSVGRTYLFAV